MTTSPLTKGTIYETTDETTYKNTWEMYTSAWKAKTREKKIALFQQALQPDCIYTDPLTQTDSWEALADYMIEFHKQIPGGHFVTEWFLAHHNCSIAKWHMHAGDGQLLGNGVSYATYNQQNKLLSMTGFFETP